MSVRPYLALIALAGTMFGGAVAASAQSSPYPLPTDPGAAAGPAQPGSAMPRHPNRLRIALAQLNLTQSQRSQIAAMVTSFRQARRTATPITRRQLLANIEGVLTQAQLGRFQTLMRHHRQRPPVPEASPASS